jgi:hypothetical protein
MTAPIIITAEMGKADQAWANGLRAKHFPHERNFLDAHITLFHHLPPSHLAEIKSRLSFLASERTSHRNHDAGQGRRLPRRQFRTFVYPR